MIIIFIFRLNIYLPIFFLLKFLNIHLFIFRMYFYGLVSFLFKSNNQTFIAQESAGTGSSQPWNGLMADHPVCSGRVLVFSCRPRVPV